MEVVVVTVIIGLHKYVLKHNPDESFALRVIPSHCESDVYVSDPFEVSSVGFLRQPARVQLTC